MAKLLKKTFGLGSKKAPPQPPKPDYRAGANRRDTDDDDSATEGAVGGGPVSGTSNSRQAARRTSSEDAPSSSTSSSRQRRTRQRANNRPVAGPRSTSIAGSSTSSVGPRRDGPILLQDYSEPFDANRSNLPVSPRSKTDDYTEPYDSAKLKKPVPRARRDRRQPEPDPEPMSLGAEQADEDPEDDGGQLYDDPHNCDLDDSGELADNSMDSMGDGEGDYPREEYEEPWEWSFKNSLAHWQGLDDSKDDYEDSPPGAVGGMSPLDLSADGMSPSSPPSDIVTNHKPSLPRSASASYPAKVEIEIGKFVDPDEKHSRNGSRNNMSDGEANGDENVGNYEEPWDLQAKTLEIENKIRAAKKRLSKPEISGGNFEDHEFNENALGKDGDSKSKLRHQMSLDGRTHPLNDTAEPGFDYDEPWDLKKKNVISQLTSAVSSYRAQEAGSPLPQLTACASTGSLPSSAKHRSPKSSPPTGTSVKKHSKFNLDLERALATGPVKPKDKIEPGIPLDKQGWYHGNLGRVEAEGMLRTQKEGSFLVRNSESSKEDYSLSLKSSRGFMHMKIVYKDQAYILGQFSQPYKSIPEMIHHYSIHKLPIKGAEHMSLSHPVCQDLL